MCVVTDRDFVLLFDVGEEGTLVVHAEGKDTVLVRHRKARTVNSAVLRATDWLEIETVEGRKHSELKLERIAGRNLEGNVFAIGVFGDLNVKDLKNRVSTGTEID